MPQVPDFLEVYQQDETAPVFLDTNWPNVGNLRWDVPKRSRDEDGSTGYDIQSANFHL